MSYILTIQDEDIPSNCFDCERFWDYEQGNCKADKNFRISDPGSIFHPNPRPEWCPLKEIIKEEL